VESWPLSLFLSACFVATVAVFLVGDDAAWRIEEIPYRYPPPYSLSRHLSLLSLWLSPAAFLLPFHVFAIHN